MQVYTGGPGRVPFRTGLALAEKCEVMDRLRSSNTLRGADGDGLDFGPAKGTELGAKCLR